MRVDVSLLNSWFTFFNDKYFGGCLPVPTLAVGMSRTRLGSLSWQYRRRLFGRRPCGYTLRISNYYDVDETAFKNVLLHEMIHLHIVSQGLKDTSPHGKIFRKIMASINADGWNVSVTARMAGQPTAPSVRRRRKRIVLAATMGDGRCLLSVVSPAYAAAIDRAVSSSTDVSSHSWYVSSDEYFADFPTVRTPKGRIVTAEAYARAVASMRKLEADSLPYGKRR